MTDPQPMPPILVAELFPEIGHHLVTLLRSLSADEWHLPASSSRRNVKDVASHLLDGSLRRLSIQRDGYTPPDDTGRVKPGEDLLGFLNRLNADWEKATRRLSPHVLIGLLDWADGQLADLFESLDPFGPAIFPVAWAGEEQSPNWMDVAREYTEKWHHTQQIFEATGRPARSPSAACSTRAWTRSCRRCRLRFATSRPRSGRPSPWRSWGKPAGRGMWSVARTAGGWSCLRPPLALVKGVKLLDLAVGEGLDLSQRRANRFRHFESAPLDDWICRSPNVEIQS